MCFRANRKLNIESLESRKLLIASVDIPDDLEAQPGSQVSAHVQLQESAGTRAAEVRLSFDPQVLTLSDSDVVAGGVWGGNAQVVVNVDQAAGTLVAFVFAAEPFSGGNGSVLEVRFGVRSTAVVGSFTVLDLTKVELNEGQVVVTPAPQAGPDSTDGRITIVAAPTTGTGQVTGFVFADANQNGQRDLSEGIPAVTIELVNAAGEVLSTTTNNQGSFSFDNLPAGSFTLRQVQPLAYIDGGINVLAITLNDQQTLSEQNFKELGLHAAYVYNRLLTTTVQPAGSENWISTLVQIQNDAGTATASASSLDSSLARSLASSTVVNQQSPIAQIQQEVLPSLMLPELLGSLEAEGESGADTLMMPYLAAPPINPVASMLQALLGSAQHSPFTDDFETEATVTSIPVSHLPPTINSRSRLSSAKPVIAEDEQPQDASNVDAVFESLSDADPIWDLL